MKFKVNDIVIVRDERIGFVSEIEREGTKWELYKVCFLDFTFNSTPQPLFLPHLTHYELSLPSPMETIIYTDKIEEYKRTFHPAKLNRERKEWFLSL